MASLKEIADFSGVSIRTVNRALKNDGYVAPATRDRVLEAAKTLGYTPNLAARSLRTGKSYEVTALIGPLSEVYTKQIAAFEHTCREHGYAVNIISGPPEAAPEAQAGVLSAILLRRPAAVALFPDSHMPLQSTIDTLVQNGIDYIDVDVFGDDLDGIRQDRKQGVWEAIHYLASVGHQRIAYLGYMELRPGHIHPRTRLDGYELAMSELGFEPIYIPVDTKWAEYEGGMTAVTDFLRHPARPTAIQVYSDEMAMGLLGGLHKARVAVPSEAAVVGFGGLRMSALSWPPLTTVVQPNEAMGRAAAELLIRKITGAPEPPEGWTETIPAQLIVREST